MYNGKRIGIVIPAFNEEGLVGGVIDTVPEFVDRVYVIDDGSTDGTWDEIVEHARRPVEAGGRTVASKPRGGEFEFDGGYPRTDDRIVPIRHDENRGVGAAIKTGYRRAVGDGVDVIAVMAGDRQMDPTVLDRLVDPVASDRVDYAKGNRLPFKEYRRGMSRWRLCGNWLLTVLTKASSGYWKMTDSQNGYTAISRRAVTAIDVDDVYDDYGYCNDLLAKLNAEGMRVADVAVEAVYGDETSTIRYHRYLPHVSGLLLRNFLWRLKTKYLVRDFHPLVFFYLLGAFATAVGALGTVYAGWLLVSTDVPVFVGATHSITLFVIGCACILFAAVLDMRQNEHLEVQFE